MLDRSCGTKCQSISSIHQCSLQICKYDTQSSSLERLVPSHQCCTSWIPSQTSRGRSLCKNGSVIVFVCGNLGFPEFVLDGIWTIDSTGIETTVNKISSLWPVHAIPDRVKTSFIFDMWRHEMGVHHSGSEDFEYLC